MYTRSYPRQENKKAVSPRAEQFNAPPPQRILTESEIPEGYSGTAILREKDSADKVCDEHCGEELSATPSARERSPMHAKKFKVTTKVTPALWRDGVDKADTRTCENQNEGLYDSLSEEALSEASKTGNVYAACIKNSDFEDAKGCEGSFENDGPDACKTEREENRCNEKERGKRRAYRRNLLRSNTEKHCFKRTLAPGLRERSFSLEDLLLGGLILLMLNEGAEDDIILIFGFLLFSSL